MTRDPTNPCGRAWAVAEAAATEGPWYVTDALKREWRKFPEIMHAWRTYHGREFDPDREAEA